MKDELSKLKLVPKVMTATTHEINGSNKGGFLAKFDREERDGE